MDRDPDDRVRFFPVLHLLTGPPGLSRNGGIWKKLKTGLREVDRAPTFMVQALHFAQYTLSDSAAEEWFGLGGKGDRIARELDAVFGLHRDVFVDSGGFQLLHADKIDLSRWGLTISPEDIYSLQMRYNPGRIASLDSPIPLRASWLDASRLLRISARNAGRLCELLPAHENSTVPYMVAHGRTPKEVQRYLRLLEAEVKPERLLGGRLGMALGSQVPLSTNPEAIIANVSSLLAWMRGHVADETPLHVFGIGDGLAGEICRRTKPSRPLSYDNSTYVQSAFRLKIFDPTRREYREYHPLVELDCKCVGCTHLATLGKPFVSDLMSRPAYRPSISNGVSVNRSDILAYIALHNLSWWRARLTIPPRRSRHGSTPLPTLIQPTKRERYRFPLSEFKPRGRNLLLLPCSKGRPYSSSRTHRKIVARLHESGLIEGTDYDRITLSGLFGPVHWNHETLPAVLNYDFELTSEASARHMMFLRLRTANVLSIVRGKYGTIVAYLRGKTYRGAFGPVIERYAAELTDRPAKVVSLLGRGKTAGRGMPT